MCDSQSKITSELNKVAIRVEDYCLTPDTTVSQAVDGILLELEHAKSTIRLLEFKLRAYESMNKV